MIRVGDICTVRTSHGIATVRVDRFGELSKPDLPIYWGTLIFAPAGLDFREDLSFGSSRVIQHFPS